jgi:hypothetical protein
LLIGFSWLMPRAYGRLLFLQDGNSEGFFTASNRRMRRTEIQRRSFG